MADPLDDILPTRRMLIGACGAIGIASLPQIVLWLRALAPRLEMQCVMTRTASEFIPPRTLGAVTQRRVYCSPGEGPSVRHVELTQWAELFVIMPASANVLGKAAQGIADDLLTTCLMAASCPVVFVPSMNARMWSKPVVQRNVDTLRRDGAHVLEPVGGLQAAPGSSAGSMPPLREILEELSRISRENTFIRAPSVADDHGSISTDS